MIPEKTEINLQNHIFSGNIYIFYAFDVGDEIELSKVEKLSTIQTRPLTIAKYFKNYHVPLSIELPQEKPNSKCMNINVHNFGVMSLTYKIPFESTLEKLKNELAALDTQFQEQSVTDAHMIFKTIKQYIKQPRFFHLRTSYVVIQVDQEPAVINATDLKTQFGNIVCSLLRFETEALSEDQKNDILQDARGYYRGDLIIIDTHAAFIYDEEYEEILDLFGFANIQQLELQYYDRLLDKLLNLVYQREVRKTPLKAYLPFVGSLIKDPVSQLSMFQVDIATIIEQIESSIKLAGDAYVSEIYTLLVERLDLQSWRSSINNKLAISKDIYMLYQHKIDGIREDLLTVLIIILIMTELIVALWKP